jgi:uncharacterized repeat protein (TIGR03803 family)
VREFIAGKSAVAFLLFCVLSTASQAQTFKTIWNFSGIGGANSQYMSLVQATDGNLYGTTYEGGGHDDGILFQITPTGSLTKLYSFCHPGTNCSDGAYPVGGLIQASNGSFYGTTSEGGATFHGTVFEMTPARRFITFHSFCVQTNCPDGAYPYGGLVQAANGNLYGTTYQGGAYDYGTIFEITPDGALNTLYNFCSLADCADGASPFAGLIQATNGNLYGTTVTGGAYNYGTVFEITPRGQLSTLYSFCSQTDCIDGYYPHVALTQAANGHLYGTTLLGGENGDGTIFEITLEGALTTLHSFSGTDGADPAGPLYEATNGHFYGTTELGGANNDGTVYKMNSAGTLITLLSFKGANGDNPSGGLVQATNGKFYGTTSSGGANSFGTIFNLNVGLVPFVESRPNSGKVGSSITILGTNLSEATSVTFHGVAATFAVVSGSEITTTVPAAATTGPVQVTTPDGTLSSNSAFRVTE